MKMSVPFVSNENNLTLHKKRANFFVLIEKIRDRISPKDQKKLGHILKEEINAVRATKA